MAPRAFRKGGLKLSLVTCPAIGAPASTGAQKARPKVEAAEWDATSQLSPAISR